MLTIHEVTSATDAKNYYAASDYYSQGQETVGKWGGKLAETLGLSGKVTKEAFDRMVDNQHPSTGEPLTPRTNDERRVGYDFTVSVPKSASILRAFAGDGLGRELDAARDQAVAGMMAEVEADMQTRVRKGGADENRTTGNMAWAAFHHTTSRPVDGQPPDMHEHTHLLCFNATMDEEEKRIKAGQFGNLKRDGEYYAAVFDSLYARELERLGFAIDRQGGKKWEIAGIPASMIATFKKRTDEVEDEAARKGITDAAEKAGLGAKTRSRKQKELTLPELRKAWDAQLTDDEREALAAVYRKEVPWGRNSVTPSEAVAFAIAHCSEQESVIPERELKQVALLFGLGSVTPEQVQAELPRHGVIVREHDGRQMATTQALQREEDFIVGFAAGGRGSVCPVGVAAGLDRTLAGGTSLNDGQWAAALGLLNSSNRVSVVDGPAGAGKSWMLQKFDEGMRRAGEQVTYLGTTTGSVDELRKKGGFKAETVAHFLMNEKMQAAAKGRRVVIDEISMLGHKDAVRLFEIARDNDLTLICVGDARQHGSVPRGALMRILKDYAGIQSFRLDEIKRQEDAGYLAAVKLLAEGRTTDGFDALDGKQWVREIGDDAERGRAMAAEYLQALQDKKSVLVISPTHAEAGRITQEIRSQLRQAGKLGPEDHEFTRLVATNASEAQRGQAFTYRPGDVLQFHQNAKGFKKGERFTVTDVAAVPLAEAGKFQLYRPEKIGLATGDRIRFTATVRTQDGKHKLANGATHGLAGFTASGIRLDNGWVIPADAGHFRSGFVETSFGSQGRTVQRVILGMSSASLPATNQEQMYVSSSRAKEKLTLYTDDKVAVRAAIGHSSQKLAALDLRPVRPKPQPRERVRKHMARLRRLAVIQGVRAAFDAPRPQKQPERQVSHER